MIQPDTQTPIRVAVLLGPTAVGKSALALRLAHDLGLEILSCDSRQIYRGMDIGTAKPTIEEQSRVRHWMIDLVDPSQGYSAFRFAKEAETIIRTSFTRGQRLIVCGGTGFYFKALSSGLVEEIEASQEVRDRYAAKVRETGAESIFEELRMVDPDYASRMQPGNIRRAVRALEVFHTTGRRFSQLKTSALPPRDIEFSTIVLTAERDSLYRRINARVDLMLEQGLWDEFRTLRSRGYTVDSPGMLGVGYREWFGVENGTLSMHRATEQIKMNTRRYAKRQGTWFRHQLSAPTIDPTLTDYTSIRECVERFFDGNTKGDLRHCMV